MFADLLSSHYFGRLESWLGQSKPVTRTPSALDRLKLVVAAVVAVVAAVELDSPSSSSSKSTASASSSSPPRSSPSAPANMPATASSSAAIRRRFSTSDRAAARSPRRRRRSCRRPAAAPRRRSCCCRRAAALPPLLARRARATAAAAAAAAAAPAVALLSFAPLAPSVCGARLRAAISRSPAVILAGAAHAGGVEGAAHRLRLEHHFLLVALAGVERSATAAASWRQPSRATSTRARTRSARG